MKSFFTAISLLTIFPVPQKWSSHVKTSSVYFPLVGLVLGFSFYGIFIFLNYLHVSADWTSLVILFAMVVITGALHLDGLADMADGFWGGKTKERILSIMKDSATGAFGVIALILLLLIKWTALKHMVDGNHVWVILPVAVVSRTTMTISAGLFKYARPNGTGHDVISNTSYKSMVVTLTYTTLFMVLFFGFASLVFILMGTVIAMLIGMYSRIKINGITGDVLGATCEITESLLLMSAPFLETYFFPEYWSFLSF